MKTLKKSATPLEIAAYVQRQLPLYTVLAGGAARDAWHGRDPKDFDLFVLHGAAETTQVEELAGRAGYYVVQYIPEAQDVKVHYTYRDNTDSCVAYCVKFTVRGVQFDLIEHMTQSKTPKEQVENFDCTLSMAWFIEDDDGELKIVTHPRFNETVRTGFVYHLPSIDGDAARRFNYLREKYPEYTYVLPKGAK